jgi:hypothetical protein
MSRAVAQLGSAPDWGSGGRRFKSCQPDHEGRSKNCSKNCTKEEPSRVIPGGFLRFVGVLLIVGLALLLRMLSR